MIVRDEESHLPACLESIRPIVDEIVMVDTGSTDRTIEIARWYGARVQVHPWEGDFSAARNIGLGLARGTWILYIDADECLRPSPPGSVRARLREASEIALRVRRRPFAGATPCWEIRIWRSDPRIRFERRIHERVAPAIAVVAAADHLTISETDLYLEHVGYDGDQTRKHERDLPLLQAQLTTDPGDVFAWGRLSRVLAGLRKPQEAEAALERAVQAARSADASAGGLVFAELVRRRREQRASADGLLEEGLRLYPDSLALAWEKVRGEVEAGRYETALHWLERFDADLDMPVEDKIAYPVRLFGVQAPQARGLCLFRLGRYREAAAAYQQAEAFEPDELSHRLKRMVAEQRARQPERDLGGPDSRISD
jgi:hypothetical protein